MCGFCVFHLGIAVGVGNELLPPSLPLPLSLFFK
jgi:hypothetical protein